MSGWGMVRAYVRRNWRAYALGVSLTAGAHVLVVWIPRLLGRVADRLQQGSLTVSDAAAYAGAIVAIGAGRVVAACGGRMLVRRKGRTLAYELRRDLFRRWETLSPAYYRRHGTGELLSHALSDVEAVGEVVSMGINVSFSGLSMLAAVLWMMVAHGDWRLMVAGLAPLLLIPVLVRRLGPRIRARSQRSQEALGRMAQVVEEVVGGIRAVKAFGNEGVVRARLGQRVDAIVAERMAFARLSAIFGALVPLMSNLGFVAILGYGGCLAIQGNISVGSFVAFTLYVAMLRQPLEHLGQVLNLVQRASASLGRLSTLLGAVPEVQDRPGPLLDRPIGGALRVDRLTFRYPGSFRAVLSDVSFEIGPGEVLGIVGPVGSGKSTLADLILRLYDPPAGTVFVDGEDVLRYPLARLRGGIAYVPQDGFLFSTTVLENVAFSDDAPDRGRAVDAAGLCAVLEDVERLAGGFDAEIGERGVRLSGGQKQRIAIARALYARAPILILDDSLSAVDTRTERRILEGLRSHAGVGPAGRRTTLVISHRLSAVRHADHILVLEDGRVVEQGRHVSLVSAGGAYAALWRRQSGGIEETASPRPFAERDGLRAQAERSDPMAVDAETADEAA